MVPEGWREASLSSVLDKIIDYRGKAPPKTESGVRLITARNVRFGFISFDHAEYIDENLFAEWMNRGLPQVGDILFTTEAPLGNVAMFPKGGPFALGQRIVTLRTGQKTNSGFLFQFLISEIGQDRILQKASGSTALGIKSRELQKVLIPLPPLAEQKRIAEVLGVWDRAIEVAGKQLDLARTQKRALMQTLLTPTRRFPGYGGQPWNEVRLGDVLKEVKRPVDWSDDHLYRLVSVRRRSGGLFHREDLHGSEILTKNLKTARAGDFLISKMQVVHGAMGLVTPDFDGMHISGSYIAVVPKSAKALDVGFWDWMCRTQDMYRRAYRCSYGVHIEKMTFNFDLFLKERLAIPSSVQEQQAVAAALYDAEAIEREHETQITRLQAEKKALMQQLLTGKKRIKI